MELPTETRECKVHGNVVSVITIGYKEAAVRWNICKFEGFGTLQFYKGVKGGWPFILVTIVLEPYLQRRKGLENLFKK